MNAPQMPRGVRNAAWACLLLSAFVGFFAASLTWDLLRLDEAQDEVSQVQLPGIPNDPEIQSRQQELLKARLSALQQMRDSRTLVVTGLSVACALAFVASSRMLRPLGLPRDGVRRLLSGAALTAAVLRTIDGAQELVVAQRLGPATQRLAAALAHVNVDPVLTPLTVQLVPRISLWVPVVQTLFVAGAFVLVAQYFRSERVRKIVQFGDSQR